VDPKLQHKFKGPNGLMMKLWIS